MKRKDFVISILEQFHSYFDGKSFDEIQCTLGALCCTFLDQVASSSGKDVKQFLFDFSRLVHGAIEDHFKDL